MFGSEREGGGRLDGRENWVRITQAYLPAGGWGEPSPGRLATNYSYCNQMDLIWIPSWLNNISDKDILVQLYN